jgi:hypothetical protein
LIGLTKLPELMDLPNLPDSPPQPQTPTTITNDEDTTAVLEAMVQLAAATPPPEVIYLSNIEPAAQQLLANRFNFNVPPARRESFQWTTNSITSKPV